MRVNVDERSQFELVPCGVCRCCVLWKAAPVAAITAEQSREQFEEWAQGKGYPTGVNPYSGCYLNIYTEDAWRIWQAARAAPASHALPYPTTSTRSEV